MYMVTEFTVTGYGIFSSVHFMSDLITSCGNVENVVDLYGGTMHVF